MSCSTKYIWTVLLKTVLGNFVPIKNFYSFLLYFTQFWAPKQKWVSELLTLFFGFSLTADNSNAFMLYNRGIFSRKRWTVIVGHQHFHSWIELVSCSFSNNFFARNIACSNIKVCEKGGLFITWNIFWGL